MKILVVGSGGREHALAWKLLQSAQVEAVFCAPGNGGTATMARCQNLPLVVEDFQGIGDAACNLGIDLVVIGPEVPLALGITDVLQQRGVKVFGPTKAAAQLEASKAWAKEFMQEAGIPTAESATFDTLEPAQDYVRSRGASIVIKADGLAAGKGVIVADTTEVALQALSDIFGGQFGAAGQRVVVEECLVGQEASVLALTDGQTIRALVPSQDHKRVGEGDTGANTGGMGAYAPAPVVTPKLMAEIQQRVLEPTIVTLRDRGIDYCGVVYAGLMISPEGKIGVLEFNCRFGDPETQVVLPLMETPLEDLMLACVEKRLADCPPIQWKSGVAACIVMASGGYPAAYNKGDAIAGLEDAEELGASVFHAGTRSQLDTILTDGGRVLGVTAIGDDFDLAFKNAYAAVDCIQFRDAYWRRDIGYRVRTDL